MFHTYVLNSEGVPIDIDRAMFLMDKGLVAEGLAWLEREWPNLAARSASTRAQAFFDDYCDRHAEKYGTVFAPNCSTEPY